MKVSEQIRIERKKIIEWDVDLHNGDGMRAITGEILWMLGKLEKPEGFDKMLSLNQRINNMRILIKKEPNFDSFRKRKYETLDRLESVRKDGGKEE